jgi:hypothetical protein
MNTTHLQSIGTVAAKPAGEVKAGDVLAFNGGIESTVASVDDVSAKFVVIHYTHGHSHRKAKSFLMGVAA